MRKEAVGELIPEPNKDALNMVLGKDDHHGRVVGHGGVRLGVKKVKAVVASTSKGSSSQSEVSDAKTMQLKSELQQTFGEMLKANNEMLLSNIKSFFQEIGVSEQVTQEFMNGAQQMVLPCDQSSRQPTPSTHVPTPSPLNLEVNAYGLSHLISFYFVNWLPLVLLLLTHSHLLSHTHVLFCCSCHTHSISSYCSLTHT